MVGAAVAAGVAVAATAASAAMQASAGGADGSEVAGAAVPPLYERLFNRELRDTIDTQKSVIEEAIGQGNLLAPELYRFLGYEPIVEETPGRAEALAGLDAARSKVNEIDQELADLKGQKITGKGKAKAQAQKAKQKRIKELQKARTNAQKSLTIAERQAGQVTAQPNRITGFRRLPADQIDPRSPFSALNPSRQALDLENEALLRALKGEEPLDPTLKNAFDEKEAILREKLLRQFGPDYEASTIGSDALRNFERERGEAFSQYNREVIGQYDQMSLNREKGLSDLGGAHLEQATYIPKFLASQGLALGDVIRNQNNYANTMLQARGLKVDAAKSKAAIEANNQDPGMAAVSSALGAIGSGAGSVAMGYATPTA